MFFSSYSFMFNTLFNDITLKPALACKINVWLTSKFPTCGWYWFLQSRCGCSSELHYTNEMLHSWVLNCVSNFCLHCVLGENSTQFTNSLRCLAHFRRMPEQHEHKLALPVNSQKHHNSQIYLSFERKINPIIFWNIGQGSTPG